MTFEVLELFRKQTRSLYETSFFAFLILLSKGWHLVLNSMGRKEFNYFIVLIILIYIFDSASNIIGSDLNGVALLLYVSIIIHIVVYSSGTIRLLRTQLEVMREAGMEMLFPISNKKKKLFLGFLGLIALYFGGEFFFHFWLYWRVLHLKYSWLTIVALINGSHELLEILVISGIFYIYRARDMGRFFNVDFESRANSRRVLPFYESKKECETGDIIAVHLPRSGILLGNFKK